MGVKQVAAGLGLIGLVVATVQQLADLHGLIATHFWWVLTAAWALAAGAAIPRARTVEPARERVSAARVLVDVLRRWKWVLLVSVAALTLAGFHFYEQRRTVVGPDIEHDPRSPLGAASQRLLLFGISEASAAPIEPVRLLQFGLEADRTTYIENVNDASLREFDLPAQIKERLLEVSVWRAVTEYLEDDCDKYVRAKMPRLALQRFAKSSGRVGLIKYFESDSLLSSLPVRRPSKAFDLIPSSEEWDRLRAEDPVDYALLLAWHRHCIGMPYPVFRFLVDNASERNAVLYAIRYYVLDQRHVLAAGSTPELLVPGTPIVQSIDDSWSRVGPTAWIDYRPLRAKETLQYLSSNDAVTASLRIPPALQRSVKHPISLPAGSSTLVGLQLFLECSPGFSTSGETLLMAIEFVTSIGSVRTEEFVLKAIPFCGG